MCATRHTLQKVRIANYDVSFWLLINGANWLSTAWSVFAKAVKVEAGGMLLETRAFSLAKFLGFLIN